ncbi:MAG TPA: recombinase family protein, partial [Gemmatimonadales bacterium]|nr:recombinase family protein [Gemmatimonadales bacterium]
MRVVGYIRESQDPDETRPAFAQHEELRRWCADRGHSLIAVCQDTRQPGRALGRDGYVSMLGVIGSGRADMVVIPGLDTLSADQ